MLKRETWYPCTRIYLVSENIPFSTKALLILMTSAFFGKNDDDDEDDDDDDDEELFLWYG